MTLTYLTCSLALVFSTQLISANPMLRDVVNLAKQLDIEKRWTQEDVGNFWKVCGQEPVEFCLVIDSSSSIDPRDFEKGQQFLQDFLRGLEIGRENNQIRVAAVTFGKGVYTEDSFNLDTYDSETEVREALAGMPFHHGTRTDTGDAIKYMREKQMINTRIGVPKISIVITDGNSQRTNYTKEQAAQAREADISMFAVGVGNNVSYTELLNIAGDAEHVFQVDNYDDLQEIKELLAHKTCFLKPKPTTTPPMAQPCSELYPSDVVFVFSPPVLGVNDASWVIQFISHTIDNEELENGFQYGAVTGLCPEDGGFALNQYQTAEEIREHLLRYDRNNLPDLVSHAASTAFTAQNGARPDSNKVAVIFMGKSKVDKDEMETAIQELQSSGVEVFVVRVKDEAASVPDGARVLGTGSSSMQAAELVQHICHLDEE